MNNSRHQYSDILTVQENGSLKDKYRILSTFPPILPREIRTDSDEYYTFGAEDRLDTLAYKFYSDATLWWVICIANELSSPFDKTLTPGKVLRIPSNVDRVMTVIKTKSRKV